MDRKLQFIEASRLGEGRRILHGTFPCSCNRQVDVLVSDARCYRCIMCGSYFLLDRRDTDRFKQTYYPEVTYLDAESAESMLPLIHEV